jgi:hypothetical protein
MYSQRYHRQFERTLAQLRQLQEERRTAERLQLDAAASLLEMHKEDGLPYNPADDGFVFSTSDIEAFIHHNNRLDEAMERACAASS